MVAQTDEQGGVGGHDGHDQHRDVGQGGEEELEEPMRGHARSIEVVEDDQQRPGAGQVVDQEGRPVEQR